MNQFVILDRDGVINEDSVDYIKSPEEWNPIPGSLEAIALFNSRGYDVFVATNQAGIARGKLTLESLIAIHEKMHKAVTEAGGVIKDIRYCPHHPDEHCDCRKPEPGLLLQLAEAHQLDLRNGAYAGDSLKDLRAGEAAGCTPVLIMTGNGQETLRVRPNHEPRFENLLAFAEHWVSR